MRETYFYEKFLSSTINFFVVGIVFLALGFLIPFHISEKILFISLFFFYSLCCIFFFEGKFLGMKVLRSEFKESYSQKQLVLYSVLYTLSFSTLFFHVVFPFDLFLINMLCIQLPCIFLTGTTLHGFVSGKIVTVKYIK